MKSSETVFFYEDHFVIEQTKGDEVDYQSYTYLSDLLCVFVFPKFYNLVTNQREDIVIRKETIPIGLESFIREYADSHDRFHRDNNKYYRDKVEQIILKKEPSGG